MKLRSDDLEESLKTIYFGGGTPSVLERQDIDLILDSAHKYFRVDSQEITLEANPEDLNERYLKDLMQSGINRLSIGIQTFNNSLLTYVNRNHDRDTAMRAYDTARDTGFDNINLDLIYALPESSREILENDLETLANIKPDHISIYAFTVEPKTAFENWIRKGKINTVDEEEEANQFEHIIHFLKEAGYEQYEISNFARNEKYSRHNRSYWDLTQYLGIGPSAHSLVNGQRWKNPSHNKKYIDSLSAGNLPAELEESDSVSLANDYVFTSLRTKWGCDLEFLKNRFNHTLENREINRLTEGGLIEEVNSKLFLTDRGKLLADEIAARLFIDE